MKSEINRLSLELDIWVGEIVSQHQYGAGQRRRIGTAKKNTQLKREHNRREDDSEDD